MRSSVKFKSAPALSSAKDKMKPRALSAPGKPRSSLSSGKPRSSLSSGKSRSFLSSGKSRSSLSQFKSSKRRRFSPTIEKTPKTHDEKEQIPQPKDHKFALGEIVVLYFDDRAKKIIAAVPWSSTASPLSKVSTYGKVVQATNDLATVSFRRPSGSFSAAMASPAPLSAEGGIPLFALMNSNFIADKGEKFNTKSTASIGTMVKVYFDPISGQKVDEPTMYEVSGRIVAPGVVEAVKPTIKTVVVKGVIPLGKKIELFVANGKVSLKQIPGGVRLPGTVVHVSDGVSTLSYKLPEKTEGKYVQRYSPTNVTGKYVTDPRFIRRVSPDRQRQIAMYKPPTPPLCVGETFDPRTPDNCFVRGMEARLQPIISLKKKFVGTAGGGSNPFCDFSNPGVQAHQVAVCEFARVLANRHPKEIGGIRGMLCYHSVGSNQVLKNDRPRVNGYPVGNTLAFRLRSSR